MSTNLTAKRKKILAEMGKLTRLRRAALSEQYYSKTNASGRDYQQGPYYVLTSYPNGKKQTRRIPRDQAPELQEEIRNYQKMRQLFDELLDVTERMTLNTKTGRRTTKRK